MTSRAVSRQLENQLDIALTAARLGIWEWDVAAGRVTWSEQIEALHGMEPGSFGGDFESFAATIHPDDRADVLVAIQRTLETGDDLHNHFRFLRADGTHGWLRGVGRVLYTDNGGTPTRVIGVAMDVTEQTEAQLRLLAAYEERDTVARTLQAGLLPPVIPRVEGLDLAAAYHPGDGQIGGDLYDVFSVGNGVWGITVGDVCGKGHEAAALTALVRHALRTGALLDDDPAAVMTAANRAHLSTDTGERFTTAHYLRLETVGDGMRVRLGSAGHPPVLIRRADGSFSPSAGVGPLLGVFDDAEFQAAEFTLGLGDMIIGYTDGVTESRTALGALFGIEGIAAAVADSPSDDAATVVEAIVSAASEHADGRLTDDLAVLVARRPA